MFLIEKGKKAQPICRHCKAIHAAKDCPNAIVERFTDGSCWTRAERDAIRRHCERSVDQALRMRNA